jgi:hypothetical protein
MKAVTVREKCIECGGELTADDVAFLGDTCNACEKERHAEFHAAEMAEPIADFSEYSPPIPTRVVAAPCAQALRAVAEAAIRLADYPDFAASQMVSELAEQAHAALALPNERDSLRLEVEGLREALRGLLEQADMGAVDEETQPLVDAARRALGEA